MRRSVYTLRVLPFYNAPFLRSSIAQIRPGEGPFCIFREIWRLAQSDGFRFVKVGWVLAMKAPFLFWSEETGLTCPTPRRSLYTPPVHPCPLQRTRNDGTRQAAGQTVLDAKQGAHTRTLHRSALDTRPPRHADRTSGVCWRAWSASGKVYNFGRYIYTHLYLYFLCKALDYSDINDII